MKTQSVLVVDDEREIRQLLRITLSDDHCYVLEASDGAAALQIIEDESPSVVILDLMMPTMDGFEVLRRVRERSHVPVMILSARGETEHKTRCFDLGADDYVTKPFAIEEVRSRVWAVLRRGTAVDPMLGNSSFRCGDIRIDFAARAVAVSGRDITLTATEYALLRELAVNAGKVLTYTQLLHKVWGPEYETEREDVQLYIHYLRTKIEPDPKHPRYILNISGVGYTLALNP